MDRNRFIEKPDETFPGTNPYKRKRRVKDEERIPPSIRKKFTEEILDLVLYDVENCRALRDFEPIKMNTHCIFAKKAILWGACDYDQSLSVGKTFIVYMYKQPSLSVGKAFITYKQPILSVGKTLIM